MIREKLILNEIYNKDILDIGSIGQTSSYSLWNIFQEGNPNSITGIDLPDEENKVLSNFTLSTNSSIDTNIIRGNMELYKFDKKFDVIIAGDVIEHINNQGLFLQNIYEHLREEGKLIITTPNAKWPTVFLKPNPTHTLWHDKYTLERILKINNFKISYFRYYYGNKKKYNVLFKLLTLRQAIFLICKKL